MQDTHHNVVLWYFNLACEHVVLVSQSLEPSEFRGYLCLLQGYVFKGFPRLSYGGVERNTDIQMVGESFSYPPCMLPGNVQIEKQV